MIRPFRPRQKGVTCSVEGCKNWCVSNDLCQNHNMAVRRYGSTSGKPAKSKICKGCNKEFAHKYEITEYCSIGCYHKTPEQKKKNYDAVKAYRANNIESIRERDNLGRRTRRRFGSKAPCVICKKQGETHHPDYDKPYEIIWLCRKHHKDVHNNKLTIDNSNILCDKEWKAIVIKYGHKALKGKRYLRGKAVLT